MEKLNATRKTSVSPKKNCFPDRAISTDFKYETDLNFAITNLRLKTLSFAYFFVFPERKKKLFTLTTLGFFAGCRTLGTRKKRKRFLFGSRRTARGRYEGKKGGAEGSSRINETGTICHSKILQSIITIYKVI